MIVLALSAASILGDAMKVVSMTRGDVCACAADFFDDGVVPVHHFGGSSRTTHVSASARGALRK